MTAGEFSTLRLEAYGFFGLSEMSEYVCQSFFD
jgi:hypothetical protein